MQQFTPRRILHSAHQKEDQFIELVTRLVQIETPSNKPETQKELFNILCRELGSLNFATNIIPGKSSGGLLLAKPLNRHKYKSIQLMIGHCDTVWPVGTLGEMPVQRKQNSLYGPGMFDMKAGLAMMIMALNIIREFNIDLDVEPVILVNSDEETSSKDSRHMIERLAKTAERVWVLEPSLGQEGKLKTARKGIGDFSIVIHGKSAHAGLDPEKGSSAILELSYIIQKLYEMNDPARGITVNVGTINGGINTNIVAPISRAQIDVRVPNEEAAREVEHAIRNLKPSRPGIRIDVTGSIDHPPMVRNERNQHLWKLAQKQGMALGLHIEETTSGGGSDGNFTSMITATLDGLGAVGSGAHAKHEHIDIHRTLNRIALLVLLLSLPAQFASQSPRVIQMASERN